MFGPLRINMGFPSKRPKDRPTTLPVELTFYGKSEVVEVEVPVSEYPCQIAMFVMDPPYIFSSPGDGYKTITLTYLPFGSPDAIANSELALKRLNEKYGAYQSKVYVGTESEHHLFMLAKIAHSFAVAELGLDTFHPFLSDIIRLGELDKLKEFVGAPLSPRQKTDNLHSLCLKSVIIGQIKYLVCDISLLDRYDLNSYSVVVGALDTHHPDINITRQIFDYVRIKAAPPAIE